MNQYSLRVITPTITIDYIPAFYSFFADPFLIHADEDIIVLLYERFNRFISRGTIHRLEIGVKIKKLTTKCYLDNGRHSSFPFIFYVGTKIYLMPEESSRNRLAIYEIDRLALKQPKLVFEKQGLFIDSIIVKKENGLCLLYYTGHSNSDGLMMGQMINFSNMAEINFEGDPFEVSIFRPGGFIDENIVPVQKRNVKYGHGLVFYEKTFIQEIPFLENSHIFSRDDQMIIQDRSHHINYKDEVTVYDYLPREFSCVSKALFTKYL